MAGPALDDDASERGPLQRAPKLAGRVAVVTGADLGIGPAIALGLAMEGADVGVTYNSDAAGAGETADEIGRYDPELHSREMRQIPWLRPGEPWEVARLAVYLASDEADYVTGQSFTIDGGLEMNWGQGA
jgi:glucose 1-dehydrogenase